RVLNGPVQQGMYVALHGKDGRFQLMAQVQEELLAELLVAAQHVQLLFFLDSPLFHVLAYLVNSFQRQDVLVEELLPFGGFGLVDELVYQLYFPVNEVLQSVQVQVIGYQEGQHKSDEHYLPAANRYEAAQRNYRRYDKRCK